MSLVLKSGAGAGGRHRIAETEEMKSGGRDRASEARVRVDSAKPVLAARVASEYPRVQVHNRRQDITATLDVAGAGSAGTFTRGPVRGQGASQFDRTLGATTEDLKKLAKAAIDPGGAPPGESAP